MLVHTLFEHRFKRTLSAQQPPSSPPAATRGHGGVVALGGVLPAHMCTVTLHPRAASPVVINIFDL